MLENEFFKAGVFIVGISLSIYFHLSAKKEVRGDMPVMINAVVKGCAIALFLCGFIYLLATGQLGVL